MWTGPAILGSEWSNNCDHISSAVNARYTDRMEVFMISKGAGVLLASKAAVGGTKQLALYGEDRKPRVTKLNKWKSTPKEVYPPQETI